MENEIKSNQSETSVSFYIIKEHRIALAELTYMDKGLSSEYLEMLDNNNTSLEELTKVLEKSNSVLFFNRLNIPLAMRKQGYGKMLMQKVIQFCQKNNVLLINTANNYGEMGQNNLIKFYEKEGMTLIQEDGLLIYSPLLSLQSNLHKKNKI